MDRVLYFGANDSPDAKDSVFRLCGTAGDFRGTTGLVGCEDCRVKALGDGFGFELDFEGVVTDAARSAEQRGLGAVENLLGIDLGVSKGFS